MGIYDDQLRQGRLLALMPQYKKKVAKALEDIKQMLMLCKSPYVSLSWGKQSSTLMHMVYSLDSSVPALFFRGPDTNIIADFDKVMKQFQAKWPIIYFEIEREFSYKERARQWEAETGKDGVFMGFARHESKARKYTLAKADANNIFVYKSKFLRSCPLRFWSDMDIAAYVATHEIPMLSTYHRLGFTARTSAGMHIGRASEIGMDSLTDEQRERLLAAQRKRMGNHGSN